MVEWDNREIVTEAFSDDVLERERQKRLDLKDNSVIVKMPFRSRRPRPCISSLMRVALGFLQF